MFVFNSKNFSACLLSFGLIISNAGIYANALDNDYQIETDSSKHCHKPEKRRCCNPGPTGTTGDTGITGAIGATGVNVGVLEFADFFALMPPDNAATVAVGAAVGFPQDGPASGTITRLTATTFNLADIGTYEVTFQVSVSEAGQLVLNLNGSEVAYTVVGRATGTSQIVGVAIITTTLVNSVLSVNNPAGNSTALTITPLAGGTSPVSAHLIIKRLQ